MKRILGTLTLAFVALGLAFASWAQISPYGPFNNIVTATNHALIVGRGTGPVASLSVGSSATLLQGATGADPAFTATPTVTTLGATGALSTGVAASSTGTLNLSGSTSGTVSIVPQNAAGTYNYNLPTTAGTSGQVLTTAGGGSSPMTWATPSVSLLCKGGAAVNAPADTSEDILASCTIPANTLGVNGQIRVWFTAQYTSNANNKTLRVRYSGLGGALLFQGANNSTNPMIGYAWIQNRGATNSQVAASALWIGAGVGSVVLTSAVDTTASTTVVITGQKQVGSDTLTLEQYTIEILP